MPLALKQPKKKKKIHVAHLVVELSKVFVEEVQYAAALHELRHIWVLGVRIVTMS